MSKPKLPESWVPDTNDQRFGHSDQFENDGRWWVVRAVYYGGADVSFICSTGPMKFFEDAMLKTFRMACDKKPPSVFMDFGDCGRIITAGIVFFKIIEVTDQVDEEGKPLP